MVRELKSLYIISIVNSFIHRYSLKSHHPNTHTQREERERERGTTCTYSYTPNHIQIASKYIKKCSTSDFTLELDTETTSTTSELCSQRNSLFLWKCKISQKFDRHVMA